MNTETDMPTFGMNQPSLDDMDQFGVEEETSPELGSNSDIPVGDSVYDRLQAELGKPADLEPTHLPIPNRPGVAIVVDVRLDYDLLQSWVKKATHRKKFRPRVMADIVLSNQVIAITMDGKTVMDSDGENYTLASPRIHQMLKAQNTRDAIRLLFGSDGHIIGALGKVMEDAGYGEQDWDEEGDSPLPS